GLRDKQSAIGPGAQTERRGEAHAGEASARQRSLIGHLLGQPNRGYFFSSSKTSSASLRKRRSSSACSLSCATAAWFFASQPTARSYHLRASRRLSSFRWAMARKSQLQAWPPLNNCSDLSRAATAAFHSPAW